jgi:hypothetical protein
VVGKDVGHVATHLDSTDIINVWYVCMVCVYDVYMLCMMIIREVPIESKDKCLWNHKVSAYGILR